MSEAAGMGTLEGRFWSKVDKSDGCWLWTAAKSSGGYGAFKLDGKKQSAHRVAFEQAFGPIHEGLCVCHRCDVRACVNPAHLFLGSNAENVADKVAKGRQAHLGGEANGNSKLTAAQVVEIREASGTQRAIAARLGIDRSRVHRIRAGQSWAHLTAEVSP